MSDNLISLFWIQYILKEVQDIQVERNKEPTFLAQASSRKGNELTKGGAVTKGHHIT